MAQMNAKLLKDIVYASKDFVVLRPSLQLKYSTEQPRSYAKIGHENNNSNF